MSRKNKKTPTAADGRGSYDIKALFKKQAQLHSSRLPPACVGVAAPPGLPVSDIHEDDQGMATTSTVPRRGDGIAVSGDTVSKYFTGSCNNGSPADQQTCDIMVTEGHMCVTSCLPVDKKARLSLSRRARPRCPDVGNNSDTSAVTDLTSEDTAVISGRQGSETLANASLMDMAPSYKTKLKRKRSPVAPGQSSIDLPHGRVRDCIVTPTASQSSCDASGSREYERTKMDVPGCLAMPGDGYSSRNDVKISNEQDYSQDHIYTELGSSAIRYDDAKNYDGTHDKADTNQNSAPDNADRHQDGVPDTREDNAKDPSVEEFQVPYYLENFLLIIDTVIKDEFYAHLFNDEDLETVAKFQDLSDMAKKLYVRLFQRKHRWIRSGKISYPKIADDLSPVLSELVAKGLLMDELELNDVGDTVNALPAPEVRSLAKSLHLLKAGSQREALVAAIIKHSRSNNLGSFFHGASTAMTNAVTKRAKSLLGACYKLAPTHRTVFIRTMMLFGLPRTRGDDEENGGGQQQVFEMLMSNIGRTKYPQYDILRASTIFVDRDALLRFAAALQTEAEIMECLESKDYSAGVEIYAVAKATADAVMIDDDMISHDGDLPDYLRVFTAGAVFARVLSQGVELLQYTRRYREAADQLTALLRQTLYHPDYRGRWYDRLALNLDYHLKEHYKALDIIKQALADPYVRTGHRYALYQRAQKICTTQAKNKWLRVRWAEFKDDPMSQVKDAPKVTIQGRRISRSLPGATAVYVTEDSMTSDTDDVTLITRVEDVVLVHYRGNGYPEGIHGEGGTLSCLFHLLLWDVVFMPGIPDVFYTAFQTHPLDVHTRDFYTNRREAIDKRLAEIRIAPEEELCAAVESCWEEHEGTLCGGLNWERFRDCQQAKDLVTCMGGKALAAIFNRMAKDLRHTRGGVPDLLVWNTEAKTFKFSEVKGPGDRLSTKQILWLDFLVKQGIDAEVCHVEAVGAKKLHR